MTQRGKCEKHNALVLTIIQQLRFWQVWMCFDLNDGGFDSCGLIYWRQVIQGDVRQPDGPALAHVNKSFHRPPRVEQGHAVVINYITVFISRILIIPGLECERSMNEIEIQIGELESIQTCEECRFHALRSMIRIPQFCRHEDVLARQVLRGKPLLQRLTYFAFVPVSLCAIEVPKSCFERASGGTDRGSRIRNECAKPKYRDLAAAMIERYSRCPKVVRIRHSAPGRIRLVG